jgi:hypothetical protein
MGTVNLPKTNQVGTNEWEDVEANDRALRDEINGNLDNSNLRAAAAIAYSKLAALSTGQIVAGNAGTPTATTLSGDATISAVGALTIASGAVGGAKLASDVVGIYRTVHTAKGFLQNDAFAATYAVGNTASTFPPGMIASGTGIGTATGEGHPPELFLLDDADYAVSGRTTKLRISAQVAANATSPGTITLTFGLYPVTVAGGADTLTYSLGTVVTGSTAVATNPSASTITSAVGSDFNVPADGTYALGVVTSAALPNNCAVSVHAQLQLRHV